MSPFRRRNDATSGEVPADEDLAPRGPLARRGLFAGAAVAFAALVLGLEFVTSSPVVCGSCHEMGPRTSSWKVSAHVQVRCVSCHVTPHPWYAFPETLLERTKLLARDVSKHLAGGYRDPVDSRGPKTSPMEDMVCLKCHDADRKATSGFRILIEHGEHARRNGSCVSCHITVAHPIPTRGRAMSMMTQCFTCHGNTKTAKAPATCALCHPADYELLPGSHAPAKWKAEHGRTAKADPGQCTMCHSQQQCDGCHGLRMPHPEGWGRSEGHPAAAKKDRSICGRCHTEKPDLCSMCHHKDWDPKKGAWMKQHFTVVEQQGAAFCLDCHSPVYCARCHVRPEAAEEAGL